MRHHYLLAIPLTSVLLWRMWHGSGLRTTGGAGCTSSMELEPLVLIARFGPQPES